MATGKVDGIVPLSVSLASGAVGKITINDNQCYRIGRMVIVNIRFTNSGYTTRGNTFINGLPRGETTVADGSSFVAAANNRMANISICNRTGADNSGIINAETLSDQMYLVSVVYIAED